MRFSFRWMIFLIFSLWNQVSVASISSSQALAQHGSDIEDLKQKIEQNLKRDLVNQDNLIHANDFLEIITFVSFSMPNHAIKQWINEAYQCGASVNIRGLIENSMPKTMATLQQLIAENDNQGGINIDPELFDLYGIQKVPAVVVRQNKSEEGDFDIIYGTSSIKEALLSMKVSQ